MYHIDTVFYFPQNRKSLLLYISDKGFVCVFFLFGLLIASPTETGVSVLISENDQNTIVILLLLFFQGKLQNNAPVFSTDASYSATHKGLRCNCNYL